jgi:hypothetical protein
MDEERHCLRCSAILKGEHGLKVHLGRYCVGDESVKKQVFECICGVRAISQAAIRDHSAFSCVYRGEDPELVGNVLSTTARCNMDSRGLVQMEDGGKYRLRYMQLERFHHDQHFKGLSRGQFMEVWYAQFCLRNAVSRKEAQVLLDFMKRNEVGGRFKNMARYETIIRQLQTDGGRYPQADVFGLKL